MCKPSPPSSNGETITNGLSLEGVHVGTVNLMISSGTVILILFAVFFYFYCKGRRSFCGQPSTPVSPPAAPANGFQHSLPMQGFFPQYAPPPYTMAPNIQPSHAVTLPSAPSRSRPCPPIKLSSLHRHLLPSPSNNWKLALTGFTPSRTRPGMVSGPAGWKPMKLSSELNRQ